MSAVVVGAVIGAVIGGGSSIYGISKGNRQLIKAFKKQMHYAQINYNYNQAQLDRQQKSLYDASMSKLSQLALNAYQNNATVTAALAQTGFQGRTSDALKRTISGQVLRQQTAVKDANQLAVSNVRATKDALYIQTKNNFEQARENLSNSFTHGVSAFMQVLDATAKGAALGAVTAGAASAAGSAMSSGGSALSSAGSAGVDAVSGAAPAVTSAGGSAGSSALSGAASSTMQAGWGSTVGNAVGSSSSGSFMANFNTFMEQNKNYIDFLNQISDMTGSLNKGQNRRGGIYF